MPVFPWCGYDRHYGVYVNPDEATELYCDQFFDGA